ncbi:probable galactinol--sucrose galactosyltransferase 2 isoform X2 [Eucalyptus grandis]|uniref:probable galactinol--sucrose galactosyltransferase 2 isoform X2 n=1 Tax=Eucalyptus grandis TaxID=71139 RepID=UPI00192E8125|nr:probable galactinol--sucrose galactosyltransferase 2 isoform X2 [Eucalyptus grandis]
MVQAIAASCSPLSSLPLNARLSPFRCSHRRSWRPVEASRSTSTTTWKHSMFIGTRPVLKEGALSVDGKDVLTDVPENVVVTPLTNSSAFVGATSNVEGSRHVFTLGVIQDIRLLCLFRFKIWWMIPRVGVSGSDIPVETQMLLLEVREGSDLEPSDEPSYILFLPVLDGKFRSSLQGNMADELELCIESGDPAIVTSESRKAVFVNYGENPFDLMKESMKFLEKELGTFAVRERKQMPAILDWFGWCTWDAFYQEVNPKGIRQGLKSLSDGGTPAKFIIIDDGWQDTSNEFQKEGEPFVEGSEFGGRLVSIKENQKFRRSENGSLSEAPTDLKEFVSDIKGTYGLKYVYVWHALMGYWGGLLPGAEATKKYNPVLKYPMQSPGNLANMRDLSLDAMENYGVGVIDPATISQFYDDLHSYLVSQGVDGVKVDVQNILETVATDLGGRVSLTRQFQEALENSITVNFQDNSIISCMGQSTDSIYHCQQSAITRASDDYYPQNPATQTLHIAAVAYNSLFLGEVVVPDWDMFYSLHDAAEFHAVARAVGGCPVYVRNPRTSYSIMVLPKKPCPPYPVDKPGNHDFEILKKLVLPDGSVLRAKYPGRPSRDCLFIDPVMDGKSLLKIWNMNNCTGVLGIFNCQGAGSWPCTDKKVIEDAASEISASVSPSDVEFLEEVTGGSWTGDCAIFSFKTGSVHRSSVEESMNVTLKVLECDVLTISPIKVHNQKVQFAPIGLIDLYNSGGAIQAVDIRSKSSTSGIHIKGRGPGTFGAYSSTRPRSCTVNSEEREFEFREDKLLKISIPARTSSWDIVISY